MVNENECTNEEENVIYREFKRMIDEDFAWIKETYESLRVQMKETSEFDPQGTDVRMTKTLLTA